MKFIVALFLCLACPFVGKADSLPPAPAQILQVKNLYERQRFGNPYIECWSDSTGKVSFAELKTSVISPPFSLKPRLKKGNGNVWFRVAIANQTAQTHFFFRVEFEWYSTIYITSEDGKTYTYKQGINMPKAQRAFGYTIQDVLITLPKGKSVIYVSQPYENNDYTDNFEKFFSISPYQFLLDKLFFKYVFDAVLLGILLIMLVYNLFIYLSTHDKIYLYYLGMLASFIGYFVLVRDYVPFIFDLSPSVLEWFMRLSNFCSVLVIACFLFFTQTYLSTQERYPKTHKALSFMVYTMFVWQVVVLIEYFFVVNFVWAMWANFIMNVLHALTLCFLIGLSWVAFRSGGRAGKFYVYANLVALLFALYHLGAADYLGIYPNNFYTQHALKVGIISQLAIFSIALADRINTLKRDIVEKMLENERLEKEKIIAIQQLTAQKNIELEQKVKERTRELQQSNEEIQTQNEEIRAQAEILQIQKIEIEEKSRLLAEAKDRQLMNATLQVVQKNEILPEIAKFIEQLRPNLPEETKKEAKAILKQIERNTNIDEQWENLKMHFEQVHPTLFANLLARSSELTNYDLRLCAYEKMGLSRKEVSLLLNANADSIRKQQYRIKQKLKLDENTSFNDFIMSLY
jgi:hypothetical protein